MRGAGPGGSHGPPDSSAGRWGSGPHLDGDSHGLPAVDVFPEELLGQLRELHHRLLMEFRDAGFELAVCKDRAPG